MLCFDKICHSNGRQLITDSVYIDAQSIIIHIELVVP